MPLTQTSPVRLARVGLISTLVTCFCLGATLTPSRLQAKRFSPEIIETLKKTRSSYLSCKRRVLRDMRNKSLSAKRARRELSQCKERFPAYGIFQDCKRRAKKAGKKDTSCRRYLIEASFEPKRPIPFFVHEKKLFFAGVGLNDDVDTRQLKLPNFDCSRVSRSRADTTGLSPLGQNPFRTSGRDTRLLRKAWTPWIKQAKALNPDAPVGQDSIEDFIEVRGLGRLYLDKSADQPAEPLVYSNTQPCVFEAETGNLFRGMAVHYLKQQGKKRGMPFYGVAFYRNDPPVPTRALAKRVLEELGPNYRITSKAGGTLFASRAPLRERDSDGDPKNLCSAKNRNTDHEWLAIIHPNQVAETGGNPQSMPSSVQFLLVANIKNFCRYHRQALPKIPKPSSLQP